VSSDGAGQRWVTPPGPSPHRRTDPQGPQKQIFGCARGGPERKNKNGEPHGNKGGRGRSNGPRGREKGRGGKTRPPPRHGGARITHNIRVFRAFCLRECIPCGDFCRDDQRPGQSHVRPTLSPSPTTTPTLSPSAVRRIYNLTSPPISIFYLSLTLIISFTSSRFRSPLYEPTHGPRLGHKRRPGKLLPPPPPGPLPGSGLIGGH